MTDEKKTVNGIVLAVSHPKIPAHGYGLRLDSDPEVWYNGEAGVDTNIEKEEYVTLQVERKGGKWIIQGDPLTGNAPPKKKQPTANEEEDIIKEVRNGQIDILKSCVIDTDNFMSWMHGQKLEGEDTKYAITPTVVFDNLAKIRLRPEYYEVHGK